MNRGSVPEVIELERRLSDLERSIQSRALANPQAAESARFSAEAVPSPPTGLTGRTAIGGLVVEWQAAPVADLAYYELQVASTGDFQSPITSIVQGTSFTLSGDTPDEARYVRVRAVNSAGNPSDWSSVFNTATGLVTTLALAANAAQEIDRFTKTSGFTRLSHGVNQGGDPVTETYGPLIVTVFDDAVVIDPRVVFTAYVKSFVFSNENPATHNKFEVELLRRPAGFTSAADVVVDVGTNEMQSTYPIDDGSPTVDKTIVSLNEVPAFTTFDQPGAGQWEYRIRMTVNAQNSGVDHVQFEGAKLLMEFHQEKR